MLKGRKPNKHILKPLNMAPMAELEKNNTDMVECEKRQEMETFLQSEEFERDDFKQ